MFEDLQYSNFAHTSRHSIYSTSSGLGHVGIEGQKAAFLDPRILSSLNFWLWPPNAQINVRHTGIHGCDRFQTFLRSLCPTLLASDMFDAFVLKICRSKQVSFQCASHTPHTFQSCTGGLDARLRVVRPDARIRETQA